MLEAICHLVSVLILFWIAYLVSVTCSKFISLSERTLREVKDSCRAMRELSGLADEDLGLPNSDTHDALDVGTASKCKLEVSANAKSSGKTKS